MGLVTAILCGFPEAQAAKIPLQGASGFDDLVRVQFDPQLRQTRVAGRVASHLCFSLALQQEWRSTTGGMETRLKSVLSDAELEVGLRPAHELRGLPQADLASRDAALLQQDYESLLGRPAQSVSLVSLSPETTRWSATWVDAHLPSGPLTVEAFIVPLSDDWVLELSFSNVPVKEEYDSLVRSLLAGLKVHHGPGCGSQMAF
ncbi:hypothetical protein AA309_01930 [Microvirga vignae]|uniref:Uncharacterized protein n=2 Tax=Microvirga vignae TaxID=1225564 RepID=A0A0H1RPX2_9HYPH|nr:hypothetical protein AA309_01930 [Microvirga vignae]